MGWMAPVSVAVRFATLLAAVADETVRRDDVATDRLGALLAE